MGLDISVMKEEEFLSFRAGSYGGFSEFRDHLARMAGRPCAEAYWSDGADAEEWPFKELIDHSDCEGRLNALECRELLKDFEEYKDKLPDLDDDGWFKAKYAEWHEAIKIVAEGNWSYYILFH